MLIKRREEFKESGIYAMYGQVETNTHYNKRGVASLRKKINDYEKFSKNSGISAWSWNRYK